MPAASFNAMALLDMAGPPTAVASPRSKTSTRYRIWECRPGRCCRQVLQALTSYFPSSRAMLALDGLLGDVIHFPPRSQGVWGTQKTCRGLSIVFDQDAGQ